jgi:hypothetical protein
MTCTIKAILARFDGDRKMAAAYCYKNFTNTSLSAETREEYGEYVPYFLTEDRAARATA